MTRHHIIGWLLMLVLIPGFVGCQTAATEATEHDPALTIDQAPDPFGRYEPAVTLSVGKCYSPTAWLPADDTPENNVYTRHLSEQLHIEIDMYWLLDCAHEAHRINLAIASGDLPDAMIVDYRYMRQMADAGQLADLTDIYEQYASPAVKSVIDSTGGYALASATIDGRLMAIPGASSGADGIHLMWIRQDWLDALGLDLPRTIDELAEVAEAFTYGDPDGNGQDDTFAFAAPSAEGRLHANFLVSHNNLYGFDPIFSAFGAYPGYWLEDDNGEAVYGSLLPETQSALATLRDWYAAGYIDPEMGIRKDSKETLIKGQSGIFFAPWWMGYGPLPEALAVNPAADWRAHALPLDANGQFSPHLNAPTSRFLVIRKGAPHPEAALKIINVLKQDSDFLQSSSGVSNGFEPLKLVLSNYDSLERAMVILQDVLAGNRSEQELDRYPDLPTLRADYEAILEAKQPPYDDFQIDSWQIGHHSFNKAYSMLVGGTPILQPMNKVFSLTYQLTNTMDYRWDALEKKERESFLKIIMGAEPLDSFDAFAADWLAQGGQAITREVEQERNKSQHAGFLYER